MEFIGADLSLEDYWRSIILLGKNDASYKFALAKSLLEISKIGKTFVSLEELAEPFSRYTTEHLCLSDRQTRVLSKPYPFIEACRRFNAGEITQAQLIKATLKEGFNAVLQRFHNVNGDAIPELFFSEQGSRGNKGIIIHDNLFQLLERDKSSSFPSEIEARWRLVETAWELKLPRRMIVSYDDGNHILYNINLRRPTITPCRPALNGYQKGKCFYCFADISVNEVSLNCEVDHFLPHDLKKHRVSFNVDGIWNLVLACETCNSKKSTRIPALPYLKRLYRRNETLICSLHPLRETLIAQTGALPEARRHYLQSNYREAHSILIQTWKPTYEHPPTF